MTIARILAQILLSSLILFFSLAAQAKTLSGTVVSVADGDTITVLDIHRDQHKIRVAGVDAPEKKQPYGQRSQQAISILVFGKEVDVLWDKRDRYQRIVGKVMVADPNCRTDRCAKTLDAGLAQVTVSLAWWYQKYAKGQSVEDAGRYAFAEHEARAKHAGLWSDPDPIPPWAWRKGER